MSKCNKLLQAEGKAYPRTCQVCGLGPCNQAKVVPVGVTPEHVQDLVKFATIPTMPAEELHALVKAALAASPVLGGSHVSELVAELVIKRITVTPA